MHCFLCSQQSAVSYEHADIWVTCKNAEESRIILTVAAA
jgi:hypothetical protein